MEYEEFNRHRRRVSTPRGELSYVEMGEGPPALFVHGVFLGAALWMDVVEAVRDRRRCIAIDLPGHGESPVDPEQDVSLGGLTDVLAAACDALGLDSVDLVANDTGGAIAQVLAVRRPGLVRSLTLTNCDVHSNLPPELFRPAVESAARGELAPTLSQMANDLELGRTAGLGVGLEHPERLSDDVVRSFLGRFADLDQAREIERILVGARAEDLMAIEPALSRLEVPTLIVWGTGDPYFDVEWAHWLRDTIPGAGEVVEIPGAKLFHPAERAGDLVPHLVRHWEAVEAAGPAAPSGAAA